MFRTPLLSVTAAALIALSGGAIANDKLEPGGGFELMTGVPSIAMSERDLGNTRGSLTRVVFINCTSGAPPSSCGQVITAYNGGGQLTQKDFGVSCSFPGCAKPISSFNNCVSSCVNMVVGRTIQ